MNAAGGGELTVAPSRNPATQADVYASPRMVTDLRECYFYHTMDIPGYGHVEGEWDLREGIRAYLGNVNVRRKRVLEIGTASGFACFHMEREGADVVAYDLSEDQAWDVVPFARLDHAAFLSKMKQHIRKLNNGFWLCHRALQSRSRLVYGSVYSVPDQIGPVDICTFGSVLLHLRDPFLALQKALRLTRETAIVTDVIDVSDLPGLPAENGAEADARRAPAVGYPSAVPRSTGGSADRALGTLAKRVALMTPGLRDVLLERDRLQGERETLLRDRARLLAEHDRLLREHVQLEFLPRWQSAQPNDTWWRLSPHIVEQFLGVLGFERTEVTYHTQKYSGGEGKLFTVVGHRTAGEPR